MPGSSFHFVPFISFARYGHSSGKPSEKGASCATPSAFA